MEKRCIVCNKVLHNRQQKFCSKDCEQQYKYDKYIKRWKQGLENGMRGEYSLSKYVRRYMLEKAGYKCERCGWNKINPFTGNIPLEIEHIDGNYYNNVESNLAVLCPNCHSLTATYKGANKGKGRKERKKYY